MIGAKGDWDFRISDLAKTLMKLLYNPCGEFWWILEDPVSQIHSPHLHVGATAIFQILSDAEKRGGAESNGKLPYLFIPSKTATLVPEFPVEDLPLSRTATLIPAFAVKYLPLGRTLWWWWWWWWWWWYVSILLVIIRWMNSVLCQFGCSNTFECF